MELALFFINTTIICSILLLRLVYCWWVSPIRTHRNLKQKGFKGPTPYFPLGNTMEMKREIQRVQESSYKSSHIFHDIHSTVFPYFSRWQKLHGIFHNLTFISFIYNVFLFHFFYR